MTYVQDKIDRWHRLAEDRAPWEEMWMASGAFVVPNTSRFDRMFTTGTGTARLASVVETVAARPFAANASPAVYDQTSILAVIRGAAGEQGLVTPQTSYWHEIAFGGAFPRQPNDAEKRWLEEVRNYLFRMRGNARTGFWASHKAALRCKWGFGTAVMLIANDNPFMSAETPISYIYTPLSECYLATSYTGVVNTNYRLYTKSACQCCEEYENMSAKVKKMAENPKEKDKPVVLLHAVEPRYERGSRKAEAVLAETYGSSVYRAPFSSCVIEVDTQHLVEESGYYEFPYRVDHWERNGTGPYEEGPVSLCLAEIYSLNEMAKNELTASGQSVAPPIITHEDTAGLRLDLNSNAINAGYMAADGSPLAAALVTAPRPDFAMAVIEAKRDRIGQCMYLDLWQPLIDIGRQRDITAFQSMIINQEKADAVGPIGTASQRGLSVQIERELAIIERMGAWMPGSPIEKPESAINDKLAPVYTSPLDRLRKNTELQAATQTIAIAGQLEGVVPGTMDKIDADNYLDYVQENSGAPREIMATDELLGARREARQQAAKIANDTAKAAAAATQVAAAGATADTLVNQPAAGRVIEEMAGL